MNNFSREHAVCPLSRIKKRHLMGGYLSLVLQHFQSVPQLVSFIEKVVRWWEGPLCEVPLYFYCFNQYVGYLGQV